MSLLPSCVLCGAVFHFPQQLPPHLRQGCQTSSSINTLRDVICPIFLFFFCFYFTHWFDLSRPELSFFVRRPRQTFILLEKP